MSTTKAERVSPAPGRGESPQHDGNIKRNTPENETIVPAEDIHEAGNTLYEIPTAEKVDATAVRDENHDGANGTASEAELLDTNEHETPTTLRPAPPPSAKRRQSEARTPEPSERPQKKRKRASPPWKFPTADTTTIKTADGRRASSRVNTGTPTVVSESDGVSGRSRGGSHSRPAAVLNGSDGPTSRSRGTSQSRPPSRPWKDFAADVPTTIQVDGKRRSGRANKELVDPPKPTRTSPRSKKAVDMPTPVEKRGPGRPRAESKALEVALSNKEARQKTQHSATKKEMASIEQLKAQIAALQSPAEDEARAARSGHKRNSSGGQNHTARGQLSTTSTRKQHRPSDASLSPGLPKTGLKLKLRRNLNLPPIPHPHPNAVPPSPPKPPQINLLQVFERYELLEQQQPYSENERGPPSREEFKVRHQRAAEQEAVTRRKLLKAAEPGNPLSREVCSIYRDDQPEPPQQYAHRDHLTAHVLYLRQLQIREKQNHRQLAKKVAYEALDQWKLRRGPTEEDLIAEADRHFKLIAKQVVADMKAKWEMAQQFVEDRRREKWEAEEEAKRRERLKQQLEWSENMVARQRGEAGSDVEMDDEEDSIGDVSAGDGSAESESGESEENMSESESEAGRSGSDAEEQGGDMDQDALAAYLAQRDTEPPDRAANGLQELYEDAEDAAEGASDYEMGSGIEDDELFADKASDVDMAEAHDTTDLEPAPEEPPALEAGDDHHTVDAVAALSVMSEQPKRRRASGQSPTEAEMHAEAEFSEDESTDMDSEDYDSEDDRSNSGDGETASDEEDSGAEQQSGLWAFFTDKEKKTLGLPTPVTSAVTSADENSADHAHLENLTQDRDTTDEANDMAIAPSRVTDEEAPAYNDQALKDPRIEELADELGSPRPVDSLLHRSDTGTPMSMARSDVIGKQLVPQPSLLRGDLRSYQHAGLDWLASLYRQGTNGILADEMGLGKTIQTISLLAHLAEHHAVWETHLVIVPTSVILNWVTEFQKFLPGFRVLGYYGSTEERQDKRRGWQNDPHHLDKDKRGYNVVITSYNVALKDITAIRQVKWHYMILDEAHNIRNFNSMRFQVLIRLRTRARLLLTGTPLQNSLTELWSLLTFLTAGADEEERHGTLEEFLHHWKGPVQEIFDKGVQTLSDEASRVVSQLHTKLRPFMLRRLKADVEKDLPKKREHTVVCKLSKRQRQLYQEYMGLADTKAKLAQGNAVTAGKVLLSLRRVCNHPDLFDPRPIQTSFAMESSPVESFAVREQLVRQLLGTSKQTPSTLLLAKNETASKQLSRRSKKLSATKVLQRQAAELDHDLGSPEHDLSTISGCQAYRRWKQRQTRLHQLREAIAFSEAALSREPIYGSDLREVLTVRATRKSAGCEVTGGLSVTTAATDYLNNSLNSMKVRPADTTYIHRDFIQAELSVDRVLSQDTILERSKLTLEDYGTTWKDRLTRFAFCTPEVTAPILDFALPSRTQKAIRSSDAYAGTATTDPFHEARIWTSIVFPDSRLLVYDAGKLQRLTHLLRALQAKGSRSLIFTQMTGTLNVLEQFLSLLSIPYLRLDGSTSVERRQLYAAEFNQPDSKYQCMILSSRAGGVGLNLIGASSVIFYDLDWNPQMDRQCMDRAHRIGQVRDVDVFKLVSEKTVEENILRRANQKSLLDQTVIQEGHFTTDYELAPKGGVGQAEDGEDGEVAAAIDRFLSGGEKTIAKTIESIEDKEDVQAAQLARKEVDQDAEEFADRDSKGTSTAPTPGFEGAEATDQAADADLKGHVDGYMIGLVERAVEGIPYVPPKIGPGIRKVDKHGRDPSHRPRRKR